MAKDAQATRRHLLDTPHGQMHVRVTGTGGVPLVLLHSMIVAGRWYEHATPLFAEDRMVIVPDRIGQGLSDPQPRRMTIEEFADATVAALDALEVDVFDLGGIHTGGIEAVEIATSRPDRVRRLVTIPVSVFSQEEADHNRGVFGPPPAPVADGSHLDWYWKFAMGLRPDGVPLAEVQGWVTDHLAASPDYWWMFDPALSYPMAERLPEITQPMLVLAPHDDMKVQWDRARRYLPPHARLVELPHIDGVLQVFTVNHEEVVGLMHDFYDAE